MKHVVLHIGTGKTGTSTIQNALYVSRSLLKKHNVDYARCCRVQVDHFGEAIVAHYKLAEIIQNRADEELKAFREYINDSPLETIIFSCENLYHHLGEKEVELLASLLHGCRVTIVCYVRRQDLYIESAYKQQVKVGVAKVNVNGFLARHTDKNHLSQVHANYYRMLMPWDQHFGTEAITVRVFDPQCFINGRLLDDFLDAAGIGDISLPDVTGSKANVAMPSELIQVVRVFNALKLIPRAEHQSFVEHLRAQFDFADYPLVSPEIRQQVLENYEQTNNQLFERFNVEKRWPLPEKIAVASDNNTTRLRSDVEVLATMMYESWREGQKAVPKHVIKKKIYLFVRDIQFFCKMCLRSQVPDVHLGRTDYLRLLAKMMLRREFSPTFYLRDNTDVSSMGMDPLLHYLRYGCRENRVPHPTISEKQAAAVTDSVMRGEHPYLNQWSDG